MNPGMLFDEVLESHEFWPSDSEFRLFWRSERASLYKRAIHPIIQSYWTLYTRDKRGG